MLEILTTASERDDATRRELRALFVELPPAQAHELFRRFDAGNDPLAEAFRHFVRHRR